MRVSPPGAPTAGGMDAIAALRPAARALSARAVLVCRYNDFLRIAMQNLLAPNCVSPAPRSSVSGGTAAWVASIAALALLASPVAAQQPRRGEITYFQPQMLKRIDAGQMPSEAEIELVFELHSGEKLTDVYVRLDDARGAPVLETVTDRPHLLLALPSGRYQVYATFNGRTIARTLVVDGTRGLIEEFRWGMQNLGGVAQPWHV